MQSNESFEYQISIPCKGSGIKDLISWTAVFHSAVWKRAARSQEVPSSFSRGQREVLRWEECTFRCWVRAHPWVQAFPRAGTPGGFAELTAGLLHALNGECLIWTERSLENKAEFLKNNLGLLLSEEQWQNLTFRLIQLSFPDSLKMLGTLSKGKKKKKVLISVLV